MLFYGVEVTAILAMLRQYPGDTKSAVSQLLGSNELWCGVWKVWGVQGVGCGGGVLSLSLFLFLRSGTSGQCGVWMVWECVGRQKIHNPSTFRPRPL